MCKLSHGCQHHVNLLLFVLQADYNRHLDEIAARIERLLLDAVRRRLLRTIDSSVTNSLSDVIDILRQWEVFTAIAADQGTLTSTLLPTIS